METFECRFFPADLSLVTTIVWNCELNVSLKIILSLEAREQNMHGNRVDWPRVLRCGDRPNEKRA